MNKKILHLPMKEPWRLILPFLLILPFILKPLRPQPCRAGEPTLSPCFTILYTGDERGTIQPCG